MHKVNNYIILYYNIFCIYIHFIIKSHMFGIFEFFPRFKARNQPNFNFEIQTLPRKVE